MDQSANNELQLANEAKCADEYYADLQVDLSINPVMLRMYAEPRAMWNYRERLGALLGPVAGKRVFDFGCGQGEEAIYFAKMGAEVHAMDVSSKGIELVKRRAEFNHLPIHAKVGDILNSGYPDEYFDVVHGIGILHHVGLDIGLKEVYRMLKPGGRAAFSEHMSNSRFVDFLRHLFDPTKEAYTENEKPLSWARCKELRGRYGNVELHRLSFLYRLRRMMPIFGKPAAQKLDHVLLTVCPPLRHFAGIVVIGVQKPPR